MSRYCVMSKISRKPAVSDDPNANPPVREMAPIQTTAATFQINNANFYVPIVTLPINDNIKFLENIKQGFKKTISWNKYKCEIKTTIKTQ